MSSPRSKADGWSGRHPVKRRRDPGAGGGSRTGRCGSAPIAAGVRQLDPRNGSVRIFGPAQGLLNDSVLHLTVDKAGRIWAATRAGLFRSVAANSRVQ